MWRVTVYRSRVFQGGIDVSKGVEGVEGVELLRSRNKQHLRCRPSPPARHPLRGYPAHCGGERGIWPSLLCPEPPSPQRHHAQRAPGTRPCAQGEGDFAARGRLSPALVGRGLDQSLSVWALARVARAMRRVAASTIWPCNENEPRPSRSASAFAARTSRAQESSVSSGVKTSLAIGT
jgi:hypothetical protein